MKKKYKLGITYSLFSGEELLRGSILSIRENVDYINVVYQDISWMGNRANDNIGVILNNLKQEGLIDAVIKFEFNQTSNSKKISKLQCKKKNLGIKDLKKNNCSHCMIMDVDEYYDKNEFKIAKQLVYEKKITHSCCSIYDYRLTPLYRMRDIRDYAVPFIFKITPVSYILGMGNMPCKVDVYRTFLFVPLLSKFYYLNCVSMHHMTGIRKDYTYKVRNSFTNTGKGGKEAVQAVLNMHNNLLTLNEKEIFEKGYIKVDDKFHVLELLKQYDIQNKEEQNEQ